MISAKHKMVFVCMDVNNAKTGEEASSKIRRVFLERRVLCSSSLTTPSPFQFKNALHKCRQNGAS